MCVSMQGGDPKNFPDFRVDPESFDATDSPSTEEDFPQDEVYDESVQKFIRVMMIDGNRQVMRQVMDKTFEYIKYLQIEKYHNAETEEQRADIELDPKVIYDMAIANCKPMLGTQIARKGGVAYTVPIPISDKTRRFKAFKFIMEAVRDKNKEVRMWERLSRELISASRNEGAAVRKKQDLHRKCEENKQYAHYRW